MRPRISTPNTMESRTVYLTRVYGFSAAHYIRSPFLSDEENQSLYGKCGRSAGHGHNYTLTVTVKGAVNPRTGMVMDVSKIDNIVNHYIIEPLDHRNLNMELKDIPIITSEVLIENIWKRLKPHFTKQELYKVGVIETRKNSFECFGN